MAVETIHLIHHTHADYGYTDLPQTCRRQLARYLQEAIAIADRTREYPEAARMRFTCEITWQFEDFLDRASDEEIASWNRLVDAGDFELGAFPFHTSALLEMNECQALLDGASAVYERYQPKSCFQNDINGLPWGLIPSLVARGVRYVMMGINPYSGAVPIKAPAGFWWQGPDGSRLLAWVGLQYCAGFSFFHPKEWRVGPVPPQDDVWFNPPQGREIFDERPPALAKAHQHLLSQLEEQLDQYPHRVLGLQITNMWRLDNDPPCEQLCHFVKAWNEAGYEPTLRLSTPSAFLSEIEKEAGDNLATIRGDWAEWWADGPTSMPAETALSQRTKCILADVVKAASDLNSRYDWKKPLEAAWKLNAGYTEHTFGSFDSLALPYGPLTLGNHAQVTNYAYQANEDARNIRAGIIRSAPTYRCASKAKHMTVLNPGIETRADWVEISAIALRFPANALRDPQSGEVVDLEEVSGPVWSAPTAEPGAPFETPGDIFSFKPVALRFFCPELPPGGNRRFELIESDRPAHSKALAPELQDNGAFFSWDWDAVTGELRSLRHLGSDRELIASGEPWGMGLPLFEMPQGFGARQKLLHRRPCEMQYSAPELDQFTLENTAHGVRCTRIFEHAHCHRIEQRWDFLSRVERIEITTTFWLKEVLDPQAVYLAFPFHIPDSKFYYYSLGHRTQVGPDQMPNSCGEYHSVGKGIEVMSTDFSLALGTGDTPLGVFESIATRKGRTTFTPSCATFYSMITENYWVTNFPHTKAAKVSVRHQFCCAGRQQHLLNDLSTGLWSYPSN